MNRGLEIRIPLQVDIGFDDAGVAKGRKITFPTLLDFPAAKVAIYPKETAIAEKFEIMVKLGVANSRMKDYYDIWALSREFDFDGAQLSDAIRATFRRRKTALPADFPGICAFARFFRGRLQAASVGGFHQARAAKNIGRGLGKSDRDHSRLFGSCLGCCDIWRRVEGKLAKRRTVERPRHLTPILV